jgi:DNA-binding LytR/AlgR family response regulator
LYAESNDNYVSVYYKEGGQYSTHLIRNTLTKVHLELSEFQDIEQCHRRYVINKQQIGKVKEEKGKVYIQIADQNIPVSKKYWPHYLG